MTIAAFSFLALTCSISAAFSSTLWATAGSSPFGPFDSTFPVTSDRALSACADTAGSAVITVVFAEVHAVSPSTRAAAKAPSLVLVIMFLSSEVDAVSARRPGCGTGRESRLQM